MHRYQPRIHLIMRKDGSNAQITDLENELYRTFVFPENIFIAVTGKLVFCTFYILDCLLNSV